MNYIMHPKRKIQSVSLAELLFGCVSVVILSLVCADSMCPKEYLGSGECPYISHEDIETMFMLVQNISEHRKEIDRVLDKNGTTIDPTIKVIDISLLRKTRRYPSIYNYEIVQLPFQAVTSALIRKFNLTTRQTQELLPSVPMQGPDSQRAHETCSKMVPDPQCDFSYPYRQIDGTCNNLEHPLWGSIGTCQRRLLPAHYTGDSGFRESVTGGHLPPPRSLSVNVHTSRLHSNYNVTYLTAFFGQFIAHDLTETPISVTAVNKTIDCCLVEENLYPQCVPISIPSDDYFYSQYGVKCINFIRSAICPTCTLGERKPINEVTVFLDASVVYGTEPDQIKELRTNDGTGRMRSVKTPHGELLPESHNPETDQCSFVDKSKICFEIADSRGNLHPPLTSLHVLFLREHNRIADKLRELNPHWDGERIFQESRHIVGAELQSLTYGEWLPIILGPEKMAEHSLALQDSGYTEYDPSVDPSSYVEYSTAVIRFGHSLVNKVIAKTSGPSGTNVRVLRDHFFKPYELASGRLEPHLLGCARRPSKKLSRDVVPDLSHFLYRRFHYEPGLDLPSINIQRGRDHGIPPYTEVAHFCSKNMTTIRDFKDLVNSNLMSSDSANVLKENYKHVDDIDLWTGMLNEIPNKKSALGPTGACVLGMQFHNVKFGDRFYFEHGNQVGSFTEDQLQEIRKRTLTKVICENTEVKKIPRSIFHFESKNNPLVDCDKVEGLNLSFWKE